MATEGACNQAHKVEKKIFESQTANFFLIVLLLQDLPEIKAAAKKLGPNATGYDLYRKFIVDMHSYAAKAGKELMVWEGFAPKGGQTGRSAHPAR